MRHEPELLILYTPERLFTNLRKSLLEMGKCISGHSRATATEITNNGILTPEITNVLNSQTYNSSNPKAFLNWIFFDEQFKPVFSSGMSGADAVNDAATHADKVKKSLQNSIH